MARCAVCESTIESKYYATSAGAVEVISRIPDPNGHTELRVKLVSTGSKRIMYACDTRSPITEQEVARAARLNQYGFEPEPEPVPQPKVDRWAKIGTKTKTR